MIRRFLKKGRQNVFQNGKFQIKSGKEGVFE